MSDELHINYPHDLGGWVKAVVVKLDGSVKPIRLNEIQRNFISMCKKAGTPLRMVLLNPRRRSYEEIMFRHVIKMVCNGVIPEPMFEKE